MVHAPRLIGFSSRAQVESFQLDLRGGLRKEMISSAEDALHLYVLRSPFICFEMAPQPLFLGKEGYNPQY